MSSSGVTGLKWAFIVICGAITMAFGLAPMKIQGCNKNEKILGIANSFSGGVFLAIAFCHILPETANLYYYSKLQKLIESNREQVPVDQQYENEIPLLQHPSPNRLVTQEEIEQLIDDYQSSFPLPYVLVVVGYAFILLIDRVLIDSHTQVAEDHGHGQRQNQIESSDATSSQFERKQLRRSRSLVGEQNHPGAYQINDAEENAMIEEELAQESALLDPEAKESRKKRKQQQLKEELQGYLKKQDKFAGAMKHILVDYKEKVRQETRDKRGQAYRTFTPPNKEAQKDFFVTNVDDKQTAEPQYRTSSDSEISQIDRRLLLKEDEKNANDGPKGPEFETQTEQDEFLVNKATEGICAGFNFSSIVLLVALTMHALFEGIALGLTKEMSATINIMLALILHKPAAAMSLGVSITKNFVEKNEEKKGIMLLSIFAAATPIGIMLGMALQHSSDIVEVVFNSFAGGTFLYIAASEVIVEEFSMPDRYKWTQYALFLCGILLITCLWFIEA